MENGQNIFSYGKIKENFLRFIGILLFYTHKKQPLPFCQIMHQLFQKGVAVTTLIFGRTPWFLLIINVHLTPLQKFWTPLMPAAEKDSF